MQPFLPIAGLIVFGSFYTLSGVVTIDPNDVMVYQLCGKYVGTIKEPGMKFMPPWYSKTKVTVKLQNFESSKSTVTDKTGCPIEICAVVVWKVKDTAKS